MEIKKVNLDRTKLSSSYIQGKQDFNRVIQTAKLTKVPTFKSPWFYGAVGLSSVAVATMLLTDFKDQNVSNEKKATPLSMRKDAQNPPIMMASVLPEEIKNPEVDDQKKNSTFQKVSSSDQNKSEKLKPTNEIVNDVPEAMPIKTSEEKHRSEFPTINGVSSGKLLVAELLNAEKIEITEKIRIVSYKVQYFDGRSDLSVQMSGDGLPKNLREQISKFNLGQMVFFTEIKGLSEDGKLRLLPSMNFKIVSN